jgi:hypothetical protein
MPSFMERGGQQERRIPSDERTVLEPNALLNRLALRAEIGQRWKACYRRGRRNEGERAG